MAVAMRIIRTRRRSHGRISAAETLATSFGSETCVSNLGTTLGDTTASPTLSAEYRASRLTPAHFPRVSRFLAVLGVALATAAGLTACGGSGDVDGIPANAVASVAGIPITKAAYHNWLTAIFDADYFEATSNIAPQGLVSDPPNFSRCVAMLKAVAPAPGSGIPRPTSAELMTKCQQLFQGVKEQTLRFLIYAARGRAQMLEEGGHINKQEVDYSFTKDRGGEFPTEAALRTYLADRHWTLADELFLVEKDIFEQRGPAAFATKYGSQASKYEEAWGARMTKKTKCLPGYRVWRCAEYTGPYVVSAPPPAALLLEIGRWQPKTSHGFTKAQKKPAEAG
jgi:hypothetical protein